MKVTGPKSESLLIERGENIDALASKSGTRRREYFFKEKVFTHAQQNATQML
jgi:hypothetical protein